MMFTYLIKHSDMKEAFYVITVVSDLISHALLELMLSCIVCLIQYSSFLSLLRTPMTVIYIN